MKLIVAIIQPTKLEAVKEALSQVEVFRLTVMDVQGFGRQKGYTEVYRGHEFTVNLLRKIEWRLADTPAAFFAASAAFVLSLVSARSFCASAA